MGHTEQSCVENIQRGQNLGVETVSNCAPCQGRGGWLGPCYLHKANNTFSNNQTAFCTQPQLDINIHFWSDINVDHTELQVAVKSCHPTTWHKSLFGPNASCKFLALQFIFLWIGLICCTLKNESVIILAYESKIRIDWPMCIMISPAKGGDHPLRPQCSLKLSWSSSLVYKQPNKFPQNYSWLKFYTEYSFIQNTNKFLDAKVSLEQLPLWVSRSVGGRVMFSDFLANLASISHSTV